MTYSLLTLTVLTVLLVNKNNRKSGKYGKEMAISLYRLPYSPSFRSIKIKSPEVKGEAFVFDRYPSW